MMLKDNRLSRLRVLILSLIMGMVSVPALGGVVVVVHPGNAVVSLTVDQVKAIFLKKRKKFPDGSPATPIDQKEDSDIYSQFANKILNKDAAQLKSYWSVQIFSGRGSPPEEVDGDKEVRSRVSSAIDAIGYIDRASVDDSVKVVFSADE